MCSVKEVSVEKRRVGFFFSRGKCTCVWVCVSVWNPVGRGW